MVSLGISVLKYQSSIVMGHLQSSMARSTVEVERLMSMIMTSLSTAMTHHKTTGLLYHHFLSGTLVWGKSVAN